MGLKLTKITRTPAGDQRMGELVREELDALQVRLSRKPPDDAPASKHAHHWKVLHEIESEIALYMYQQEYPDEEVVAHYRVAASAIVSYYEVREGAGPGDNLWAYDRALSEVIAFGSLEERKRLASVDERKFVSEEHEKVQADAQFLALLQGLRSYCVLGRAPTARLQAVVAACSGKKASGTDARIVRRWADGLLAAVDKDETRWNENVQALVQEHEQEALHGDRSSLTTGHIDVFSMWLTRLGLEQGMTCTVSSLFLPVQILELAWKTTTSS